MAAICGIHGGGANGAEALDAMLAALAGYGSERAAWTAGGTGFGRRSGTPGAECGRPRRVVPLPADRRAGLVVAADARLDDRATLCAALGVPHSERASIGDGDLILRAWLRWGRDCPRHLLGDYAFAVWDARQRILFCARDPVGVRPFYHALHGEQFVFASALEAVLAAPGVPDALDEAVVAGHLLGRPLSDARTFFAAVRKLPPGHTLTVEADAGRSGSRRPRTRVERHWQPEQTPAARPASDDACAEEFLDLYSRAVDDRLRGPDPIGTHLSGGLDSSSIAVLAARALRRRNRPPPLAFDWLPPVGSVPPKPEHAPEYALVDAVREQEGLQMFHCALGSGDVVAVLQRDGALPGVQVHMNEEAVQRCAAARGVRVLLSGWNGDGCVSHSGRQHWPHLLLSGRWRRLIAEYRAQDAGVKRFLAYGVALPFLPHEFANMLSRLRRGRPAVRRWLIDPAFARRVKPPAVPRLWAVDVRRSQLRNLQRGHLVQRIEGWAASGARRGIEYRYPLMDRRLLEFALGLPPEQFRRGRWGRWLMRYGLRAVLPPEVCWNRSKAFPARVESVDEAFVGAIPTIRQMLAACRPARASYVDMPRLWEHLDAAWFRAKPNYFVPLMQALTFLDFQPG